jgi:antitoxin component YwqK of YwqJK toxin-antitoxin module
MRIIIKMLLTILLISCSNKKEIKEYYPNGTIENEYVLIDGKIEGRFVSYYQSGKINYEGYYKNNLQSGIENKYYESGKLEQKGHYLYDKPEGWFFLYNENGGVDSTVQFILLNPGWSPFEYFNDSITSNTADSAICHTNMIEKYDKDGVFNVEKSLYCRVTYEEARINSSDSLTFIIDFTNPYQHYGYNPDSTVFCYINNDDIYKSTVRNYTYKTDFQISLVTPLNNYKIGLNYFNLLIILHSNENTKRHIYVKQPFVIKEISD